MIQFKERRKQVTLTNAGGEASCRLVREGSCGGCILGFGPLVLGRRTTRVLCESRIAYFGSKASGRAG